MPRRTLAGGLGHLDRLRVAAVRRIIAAGVAQIDASRERDIPLGCVWMADDHELLVMRAAEAHPLVQQHLTTGFFDRPAQMLVLLPPLGELAQVRPPHQPLDNDTALCSGTEQLADGRATV